jgi:hypothetical protein
MPIEMWHLGNQRSAHPSLVEWCVPQPQFMNRHALQWTFTLPRAQRRVRSNNVCGDRGSNTHLSVEWGVPQQKLVSAVS